MIARDILVHVGEVFAWTKHLLCRTFQWDLVQVFCLRLGGVGWIIPGFRPDLCSGLRSGLRCRRRVWMNERRIHHHSWSCARTVVVVVGWLDFMIFGRLIKLVLPVDIFVCVFHRKTRKNTS